MLTVDDIFKEFGGPAEMGRVIGKTTEHAASMRRRGSIPVDYWPKIIEAARERGIEIISHETLVGAHTAAHAESAA